MKKLLIIILILSSSILFAQSVNLEVNYSDNDTTIVEEKPDAEIKSNDEYKVKDKNDTWLDTWREIQPSLKEFLYEDEEEEVEWKNDLGKKKRRVSGVFRAGGGGWDFFYMPINMDDINAKLAAMHIDKFESNMIFYGGGGWGFLGKHWRIGGLGASGQLNTTGYDKTSEIGNDVTFNMSFGGFLMERVFRPINKTEIYLSTVLGNTKTKITVMKEHKQPDWDGAWKNFNTNDGSEDFYSYKTEFKNQFFSVMPSVGLRYNILRWFGVGANVGYYYGIANSNSWEIEKNTVGGSPKIDYSNIFYRFNLYFGA